MLLRDDVPDDRETKASAFAGGLGREKRLKELALDLWRDTGTINAASDFNCLAQIARRHPQSWFELWIASFPLAFCGCIDAIANKVQADAGDVLRDCARRSVASTGPSISTHSDVILKMGVKEGRDRQFAPAYARDGRFQRNLRSP